MRETGKIIPFRLREVEKTVRARSCPMTFGEFPDDLIFEHGAVSIRPNPSILCRVWRRITSAFSQRPVDHVERRLFVVR